MDASQPSLTAKARTPLDAGVIMGLAAAAVLLAALGWSYRSSFTFLIYRWQHDSNYTYGWLIVPIALAILWERRDLLANVVARPKWWGFLPLAAILAWRFQLYEKNEQWIESATIPLIIAATILAVGGWGLLRWALPALIYLLFILPLPPSLDDKLAGPLQTLATMGSVELLQVVGAPVVAEGNVILIGTQQLEVAEACRGLSMLLAFAALITAFVILMKRPLLEKVVLVVSIVPIALLCNIIRIAVTSIIYARFDRKVETAHDWAGLAMMVLALGFVMLELKIMSWLIVEDAMSPELALLRPNYSPDAGAR